MTKYEPVKLADALIEYGGHHGYCSSAMTHGGEPDCTCGFDALIEELRGMHVHTEECFSDFMDLTTPYCEWGTDDE